MPTTAPRILLVNPWIHDFAAYDFWAKPLGLLLLAAVLRQHGFRVTYIDCLDRFHPNAPPSDAYARNGRGPYLKTRIAKPAVFSDVPRHWSRYGIDPRWLRQDLAASATPDLILVTSLMTYWYPGVVETIAHLREVFPATPLFLGGVYATLCQDHARRHSGADRVFGGTGVGSILDYVAQATGRSCRRQHDPAQPDSWPYPALDLQPVINYAPLLTAIGCPYRCAYCACGFLNPIRMRRSPPSVLDEIRHWHQRFGVRDFVFYDDALLLDARRHAIPLLERIIRSGLDLRFHTPNAVHIREITPRLARLLYRAGFCTLRLGLETGRSADGDRYDHKVNRAQFIKAAATLRDAGFERHQVGAYLLWGLPGQGVGTVVEAIEMVKQAGVTPVLAHYTPIPHTELWPQAVAASRYDLAADPVVTNNAVMPCYGEGFQWETLSMLKNLIQA